VRRLWQESGGENQVWPQVHQQRAVDVAGDVLAAALAAHDLVDPGTLPQVSQVELAARLRPVQVQRQTDPPERPVSSQPAGTAGT
jgi:hypothetical protein